MSTDPPRPIPDKARVDILVSQLEHVLDERQYAELLADSIMLPVRTVEDASRQAAFRDPRLIRRSVAAATFLVNSANSEVRARSGEDISTKERRRNTEMFRNMVGHERQILLEINKLEKARAGILDTSPNPRARTKERVYQLLLAGETITPERARQILDEEEEKVREQKRARKQQARAARAGGGGSTGRSRPAARARY
jgi:hypothetical protein